MGFRFFKGLDVQVFHGFRMFGSQDFIGCRTFGFSDIDLGSSCLLGYWFFSELVGRWFFGSDRFRLLIQRWKNVMGWGNLFDKGGVWPDESTRAPGEGSDRGFAWRSSEDEGLCPTNGSGG